MSLLDWTIIFGIIAFALWGFRQGAVLGVSSLIGFAGGTLVGVKVAGKLLESGNDSPYTPLLALVAALVTGGLLAEAAAAIGYRLRVRFTSRGAIAPPATATGPVMAERRPSLLIRPTRNSPVFTASARPGKFMQSPMKSDRIVTTM